MNGNRKLSLLRIISLHGDRRKPPFCLGYRPFAFLKASRHYNNDETAGNEMLRLLHSSQRNCCKSANKVFGRSAERAIRRAKSKRFLSRVGLPLGGRSPSIDGLIAVHQPALAAYANAMAPCAKASPRIAAA
ncbi:MAG: hypothetical protein ABI541_13100 [Betaproteobacteria bacterium]